MLQVPTLDLLKNTSAGGGIGDFNPNTAHTGQQGGLRLMGDYL